MRGFLFKVFAFVIMFSGVSWAFECSYENINTLLKKWESVKSYECTMQTYNRKGQEEDLRTYLYRFMQPNFVYMKVVKGKSEGAEVVYNPETGKVRGCKKILFRFCKTFDPSDRKVVSIRGVKIYETSFKYIASVVKGYLEKGASFSFSGNNGGCIINIETKEPIYDGITKEVLLVDGNLGVPVEWKRFEANQLVYKLKCSDLKLNLNLSGEDFNL